MVKFARYSNPACRARRSPLDALAALVLLMAMEGSIAGPRPKRIAVSIKRFAITIGRAPRR